VGDRQKKRHGLFIHKNRVISGRYVHVTSVTLGRRREEAEEEEEGGSLFPIDVSIADGCEETSRCCTFPSRRNPEFMHASTGARI
jgi:hypothetical protein